MLWCADLCHSFCTCKLPVKMVKLKVILINLYITFYFILKAVHMKKHSHTLHNTHTHEIHSPKQADKLSLNIWNRGYWGLSPSRIYFSPPKTIYVEMKTIYTPIGI